MRASPGGPRAQKLAAGRQVRFTGDTYHTQSGDWAEVLPLDEHGRPTARGTFWVLRDTLRRPSDGLTSMRHGSRDLILDAVGQRILGGNVPCESGYCAKTYEAAGGEPGGHAYQYVAQFQRDNRYREIEDGDLRPGDVAVWRHYGNNQQSRGWKWGHIGVVAIDRSTGYPYLVSNFEGRRDVREIQNNGHLYIFRRVR